MLDNVGSSSGISSGLNALLVCLHVDHDSLPGQIIDSLDQFLSHSRPLQILSDPRSRDYGKKGQT